MPMATPTIADSDNGVSITRLSPKASNNPWVTLKTPPFLPTSSPRTSTRGSLCISCLSARLTASTIVSLAMENVLTLRALFAIHFFETIFHLLLELRGELFEGKAEDVPRVGRREAFLLAHRPLHFLFRVRSYRLTV